MQLLTPAWLWLASLAVPIILLYMLKLRRKQVRVSSTFLWEKLLREQQANAPWQKLKRNLLLLLQLLILFSLIFALTRPALNIPTVAEGSVIVLLDASASMNAEDVEPSRFEEAKRAVRSIIFGLSPASSMTLILVGNTPNILAASTADKSTLNDALDNAQVTQGSADWEAAFALAAGATRSDAIETSILIISDGGLPESGLPALPGDIQFLPVGASADNVGITALALRANGNAPQLFAEVTNFGETAQTVLLSFYYSEELFDSRQLTIPAGASESLTVDDLKNLAGVYKAQIASAADSLSLDDSAFAVYQTNASRRVLLISNGNLFLEQALASLPNITAFRALPAADGTLKIPDDHFDLYVFDGITPETLPNGNFLFINPESNSYFEAASATSVTAASVIEHPLTRYLDWSNVHILQARQFDAPTWADTLVESESGALVFAGQTQGQRIASINFDLRESDLPLQIAFPILFSNLINYLIPPSAFDASHSLRAGESLIILPPTGTEQILVASPSNIGYTFANEAGGIKFTDTNELGYYAVNFISQENTSAEYFAVNLFDPNESNIRPRETLQIGQAEITHTISEKVGQYEVWNWLALLALIVLMIEWQVFHRRQISFSKKSPA